MFSKLKNYIQSVVAVSESELALIDRYFESVEIEKKSYLLCDSEVCDFIAYINSGCVRHFHVKEGDEKTCDISFEGSWVTDFQSFNQGSPSKICLHALEQTNVFLIRKTELNLLYKSCPAFETFGRIMAEQVAQRATDIAMSLSSEKPEERFKKLIVSQPDLFQRVPQKHIANFLGVSAESLSRIRARVLAKEKS